jgi:signal transduction histidine kinase
MSEQVLRVLVVEDNPGDSRLIRELLAQAATFRAECAFADRLAAALEELARQTFDIVLMDLSLPDSQGFETFRAVGAKARHIPVLVLTGHNDTDMALEAVRQGAQDYFVKGQIDAALLEHGIRYAIERHRIQQELRDLNGHLEQRVAERTEELTLAYESLARANDDLRELDRMKSAFMDVTSHELRTPLTTILGVLSVLERRMPPECAEMTKLVSIAAHSSRRLERLVVRALQVEETEEYEKRVSLGPVKPADVAREALREVAAFAELRGQSLETRFEDDLPPIPLDRDKILDVLLNLLMNAIKFTPDGGSIVLSIRSAPPDFAEFRVTDTGVGIDDADKPHLFKQLFASFDTHHHSSGEYEFNKRGLGLGLALARKFVEMHRGAIGVESTQGKGATFWFRIPVR